VALTTFISTLWAAKLLENLNDAHVYANCVNKDYQDNLKVGDTVRINSIGRVTVAAYTKNTWTISPEVLDGTGQTLTITEAQYFDFGIDDIDQAQQIPKLMSSYMEEAAWGLSDVADAFLATTISAGVATANIMTAATIGTGAGDSDAFELLVDMGVQLDESNTPRNGRWLVVPPWFIGELVKDPRFTSFGTSQNVSVAMKGLIKELAGFDLRVSNNVPVTGSAYTILGGYNGAVTYAESIPKGQPEAFRIEAGFGDAVKGLHVYGAKVTRPGNLASCVVTQAT
jgi:hypothetical protein